MALQAAERAEEAQRRLEQLQQCEASRVVGKLMGLVSSAESARLVSCYVAVLPSWRLLGWFELLGW